jgi:hypothetical protein
MDTGASRTPGSTGVQPRPRREPVPRRPGQTYRTSAEAAQNRPRPSSQPPSKSRPARKPDPQPLGPGGPLGDTRGLTAAGAAVIIGLAGLLGALFDLATGTGLRWTFAILFVGGCGLAAARVHREDLLAVMIMPPLAYFFFAVVGAIVQPPGGATGAPGLKGNVMDLGTSLVLTAPTLVLATGVTAWIALRRGRQYQQRS